MIALHTTPHHTTQMHRVLRVLWSGRWAVVTPTSLILAVWRFMPQFRGYQQHDAMEFYQMLTSALDDELQVSDNSNRLHGNATWLVWRGDGLVVERPLVWNRQGALQMALWLPLVMGSLMHRLCMLRTFG